MDALLDLLPISWRLWLGRLKPAVAYIDPPRESEVVKPQSYAAYYRTPRGCPPR